MKIPKLSGEPEENDGGRSRKRAQELPDQRWISAGGEERDPEAANHREDFVWARESGK